jgi:hypothetical protein
MTSSSKGIQPALASCRMHFKKEFVLAVQRAKNHFSLFNITKMQVHGLDIEKHKLVIRSLACINNNNNKAFLKFCMHILGKLQLKILPKVGTCLSYL